MNLAVRPGGRDPFSLPGLVHFGRFKPGDRTFDDESIRPDRNPPVISGAGPEAQIRGNPQTVQSRIFAGVIDQRSKSASKETSTRAAS